MEIMKLDLKSSDPSSLIGIIVFFLLLKSLSVLKDFVSAFYSIFQFFSRFSAFTMIAGRARKNEDDNAEEKRLRIRQVTTMMENLQSFCDGDEGEMEELFEEEPSEEEVKEAFDVFDENGDGFIDSNELQKVLSVMGFPQVSELETERMIRAFDSDGDGRIDFQEFRQLTKQSF